MTSLLSMSVVAAFAMAGAASSLATETEATSQKVNSETVRFNNDDQYNAALDNLLNSLQSCGSTNAQTITYLWRLSSAEFDLRHYAKAETYARQIIELEPESTWIHDPLSVYLGKQGKYEEAIAEAQQAIRLDPRAFVHATLVLASWEWLTGKKDEAFKRVASIALPMDKRDKRSYYDTLTCFYASVGDEEKIADAIQKASELNEDGTLVDFLARDTVFDPYREKDWFTKIFVKTLLESQPTQQASPIRHFFYIAATPEARCAPRKP